MFVEVVAEVEVLETFESGVLSSCVVSEVSSTAVAELAEAAISV